MTRTVALPSVQLLLGLAVRRGLDPGSLLARAGIAREQVAPDPHVPDTERRVAVDRVVALWELVHAATGDRAISLDVLPAGGATPARYDALGLAITTASTARDAWARASRYMRAWGGFAIFDLVEDERHDRARVVFEPEPIARLGAYLAVEASVAITAAFSSATIAGDVPFREIRFAHGPPAEIAPFEAHFRAPVTFGARRTELVVDRAELDRALPPAPAALAEYVTRQAESLVARMPKATATAAEVRRLLAHELAGGEPTPARIARRLATSERTLRRRLEAEHTSFAALLDAVRREAAERALGEGSLGIGEIAFQLGFGDVSAFTRAFKRWTGTTPGAARARRR